MGNRNLPPYMEALPERPAMRACRRRTRHQHMGRPSADVLRPGLRVRPAVRQPPGTGRSATALG